MATREEMEKCRTAFRMRVLDEGLYKAVQEQIANGGQTAILALALQDLAEVRNELVETRKRIDRLYLIAVEHSHNDHGGAVVSVGFVREDLFERVRAGMPTEGLRGGGDHRYVRRIAEASEDAARISDKETGAGEGQQP